MSELIETYNEAAQVNYVNPVTREIEAVTGAPIATVCAGCPLGHWEITFEAPPPLAAPLPAPANSGPSRWLAECYCRVRATHTARLEPDPERHGGLKRAPNTRLVFRCSDLAPALADWSSRQAG